MKIGSIWSPTMVSTKSSKLKHKPSFGSNSNSLSRQNELKTIPEYTNTISTKKGVTHSKNSSLHSKKASESKENIQQLANLPTNKQHAIKKSITRKVTLRRAAETNQAIFEEFNESHDEAASRHRFSDVYKPSKFLTSGEEEKELNRRISLQSTLNSQSANSMILTKNITLLKQEPKLIIPTRDKSPNHQRFNSLAILPPDYNEFLQNQGIISDKALNTRQKQAIFPSGPSFKIERAQTEEDESHHAHWRDTSSFWGFQKQYKAHKATIQQKVGDDGDCCDVGESPKHEKLTPKILKISLAGITPLINDKQRVEASCEEKTPIGSNRSRKIRGLDSAFQVSSSIASDEFRNVHHPGSLVDALNKQSISPKLFPGGDSFAFRSQNNGSGKGKNQVSQNATFRSSFLNNDSSCRYEGALRERENGVPKHPKPDFLQTQMPECRSVSTHITGGDTSQYMGDDSFDANINAHQISHNYQDGVSAHTNSTNNFFSSNSHLSAIRGINLNCEESLDQVFSVSGRPSNLAGQKSSAVSNFSAKATRNNERVSRPKTIEEQLEEFDKLVDHIENETDLYMACQERVQEYVCDCYYFQSKQKEINAGMRSILIDWMTEVSAEFHLKRDTLYLAQYYIDLYLSNTTGCKKSELQLVGVTCLFIASKIEEIVPRKIKDFARATDDGYTVNQILAMEQSICKALKWRLNPVTLNFWINFHSNKWDQFVSSSPVVTENKMINPERDLIRFREASENSYLKYRELIQIADLIILNIDFLQYDLQALAVAIMFIIVGREFGQFSQEEITTEIPYSSDFIFTDRQGFYKVFGTFTEQSLGLDLFDLLETIQFSAKHFRLLLNFDLPLAVKKNAEHLLQDHYEEFLTYQTHNLKSLETVRAIMNEKSI